jgi:histone acetyltransferase 1
MILVSGRVENASPFCSANSFTGSADANKAINISLLQRGADAPKVIASFHPKFTYPIFGEEERIFGYQGLQVNVNFACHDLIPHVDVKWDKKFTAVGDTKAMDVESLFLGDEETSSLLPPSTSHHMRFGFII